MTPRQSVILALALAALVGAVNAAILLALAGGFLSPWALESAGYAIVFALLLAPLATGAIAWALSRRIVRRRRAALGHCPRCDYDLRDAGRLCVCPECGEPFDQPESVRGARP